MGKNFKDKLGIKEKKEKKPKPQPYEMAIDAKQFIQYADDLSLVKGISRELAADLILASEIMKLHYHLNHLDSVQPTKPEKE